MFLLRSANSAINLMFFNMKEGITALPTYGGYHAALVDCALGKDTILPAFRCIPLIFQLSYPSKNLLSCSFFIFHV